MYIAKVLSNLGAWNSIQEKHPIAFSEIEKVIESIQPQQRKHNPGRSSLGKMLVSPSDLSEQCRFQFDHFGWMKERIKFGTNRSGTSSIDAVKEKLGIEYLFGRFAFVESDIFVKFPIFIRANIIDTAIILLPTKALTDHMIAGSNVGSLEMLQNRLDEIPKRVSENLKE